MFIFFEQKSSTRVFSGALMIGEGGFGSVHRRFIRISDHYDGPNSMLNIVIK